MAKGKISTVKVYQIACGSCSYTDEYRDEISLKDAVKHARTDGWKLRHGHWACYSCSEKEDVKVKLEKAGEIPLPTTPGLKCSCVRRPGLIGGFFIRDGIPVCSACGCER